MHGTTNINSQYQISLTVRPTKSILQTSTLVHKCQMQNHTNYWQAGTVSRPQHAFGEATTCHDSNTGLNKLSPEDARIRAMYVCIYTVLTMMLRKFLTFQCQIASCGSPVNGKCATRSYPTALFVKTFGPIKTEVSCPAINQPQHDTKHLNQSKVQVYHYTHLTRQSDTFALLRVLCLQKQTCHKKKLGCRSHRIRVKLRTGELRTYTFKQAASHHNIALTSLCTHSYKTRSLSVRRSAHLLILNEVSLWVSQLQDKVNRSRPRPASAVTIGFNKSDFLPIANAIQTLIGSNPIWEPPSTSRNTA